MLFQMLLLQVLSTRHKASDEVLDATAKAPAMDVIYKDPAETWETLAEGSETLFPPLDNIQIRDNIQLYENKQIWVNIQKGGYIQV